MWPQKEAVCFYVTQQLSHASAGRLPTYTLHPLRASTALCPLQGGSGLKVRSRATDKDLSSVIRHSLYSET